jgi:hypothetical protein
MLGCRRENKGERESPVSEMERPVQSRIDHPHQKPSKRLAVVDERANDGKHSNRVKNDDDDSFANT